MGLNTPLFYACSRRSLVQLPKSMPSKLPSIIHQKKFITGIHQLIRPSSTCSRTWNFKDLSPFGSLVLRTGASVSYKVTPVDPQDNPSQDTATVTLEGSNCDAIHCEQRDDDILLKSSGTCDSNPMQCVVKIPVKFSTDAILGADSGISVNSFECDSVQIKLESGQCNLKSIQCKNMTVFSHDGPIISEKSLMGKIWLQTYSGEVSLHKPIGPSLQISTENGNIHVKNLYSDESDIRCMQGDVHISNSHQSSSVHIQEGNLKVDSVDGGLSAKVDSGSINVHLDNHSDVQLATKKGDIKVTMPVELESIVELQGNNVEIDDKLNTSQLVSVKENSAMLVTGSLKGTEDGDKRPYKLVRPKSLKAHTSDGSITLKPLDWFSSLNIAGLSKQ